MAFSITAIAKRLCQRGFRNGTDDVSQEFVFVDKKLYIFLPASTVHRPDEPVGAFYRKSLPLSRQASPRNVFPISGVNRKFPDIVPLFGGSPCSLGVSQSSQRAEKRGTVP